MSWAGSAETAFKDPQTSLTHGPLRAQVVEFVVACVGCELGVVVVVSGGHQSLVASLCSLLTRLEIIGHFIQRVAVESLGPTRRKALRAGQRRSVSCCRPRVTTPQLTMAMIRGVMWVRSRLKPSSTNRFFFLLTIPRRPLVERLPRERVDRAVRAWRRGC